MWLDSRADCDPNPRANCHSNPRVDCPSNPSADCHSNPRADCRAHADRNAHPCTHATDCAPDADSTVCSEHYGVRLASELRNAGEQLQR
jgi:hypothetical protein